MKRLIGLIVVVIGIYILYVYVVGAPRSNDEFVTVDIVSGSGVNAIGHVLKDAGLIRSSFAFETYVWSLGAEGDIQAGSYTLSRNSDLFSLVKILRSGVEPARERVTLIEGWTVHQYLDYLEDQGFDRSAFETLVNDVSAWEKDYSFLVEIPEKHSLEGYLYPDTYAITVNKDPERLIEKMLSNFEMKTNNYLDMNPVRLKNFYEVVIMASIVEKEVSSAEDRELVADIFLKRLENGIGLQSDATINYITKSGRSRSTSDDISIDSPYNTYKYRGLPPGPIGNPSLESIRAVLFPKENDYFYFLTDSAGTVHYARNFDEHQVNRQQYLDQ